MRLKLLKKNNLKQQKAMLIKTAALCMERWKRSKCKLCFGFLAAPCTVTMGAEMVLLSELCHLSLYTFSAVLRKLKKPLRRVFQKNSSSSLRGTEPGYVNAEGGLGVVGHRSLGPLF